MAVPTIRAVGAVTTNTASPIAPALPTYQEGDLLLLLVGCGSNNTTSTSISTPTGYTEVGTIAVNTGTIRGTATVYAKKATASESAPSVTVSPTGTASHHAARVISITAGTWNDTGTLADAWEDVTTGSDGATTGDVLVVLTGLATAGPDRLCVAHLFEADNVASGLSDDATYSAQGTDSDSATGSDGYLGTRSKDVATQGGGAATFTFIGGGGTSSPPCLGVAFAVRPTGNVTVGGGTVSGVATLGGGVATSATVGGGTLAGAGTLSGSVTTESEVTLGGGAISGAAVLTGSAQIQSLAPWVQSLAGRHFTGTVNVTGLTDLTVGIQAGGPAGLATLAGNVSAADVTIGGGTLSGAATLGGAPERQVNFSGQLAGVAALAASLALTLNISGTMSGAAALGGSLDRTLYLSGQVSGAAALAGTPTTAVLIGGGTVAGAAVLAGNLDRTATFSGQVLGQAALGGGLDVTRLLSGAVAGQAALGGSLENTGATDPPWVASLAGQHFDPGTTVYVTGRSQPQHLGGGAVQGHATLAGTPTTAVALTGAIAGQAAIAGPVTAVKFFSGSIQGAAALAGSPSPNVLVSGGTVAGVAVLGGQLDVMRLLAGTVAGASTLAGAVSVQTTTITDPPSVDWLGGQHYQTGQTVYVTGTTAVTVTLTGSIVGRATLGGIPSADRLFSGAIAGSAVLTGPVQVTKRFAGAIAGAATLGGAVTLPFALTFTSPPEGATVDYPFTVTGTAPAGTTVELRGDHGWFLSRPTVSTGVFSQLIVGPTLGGSIAGEATLSGATLQNEEGEEGMPAHTVNEGIFTAPAGATAVQADSAGQAGAPPSSRYRVRIVNPDPSSRLYVGRTQVAAQAASAEVVEADYGVWEDYLDASVPVWVRSAGGAAVVGRLVQYALT